MDRPPGKLVSDALRDGYAASGWFARVEREPDASIDAELHGRVLAIEEVDLTETRWAAHLRLELELFDARTHERLWAHDYDLTRPLAERSPDGLAAAISAGLREVIDASAPSLGAASSRSCARAGARHQPPAIGRGADGTSGRKSFCDLRLAGSAKTAGRIAAARPSMGFEVGLVVVRTDFSGRRRRGPECCESWRAVLCTGRARDRRLRRGALSVI
ncbi:hypothetical protein OV079_50835 [Nannocystis pusilla]|uniref:Uncharacterized protein n=1 Tax=Nannocystis pusilla TaxID=889268 RepID=A0A9X3J521_9BACT|nr:hypothetical protein [Nannocystis pusilla]MCY1013693.1 hypothetical protein [Nannocystis pusilla]